MSGPARSRDHRREAHRRVVNLVYRILRAPPKRASGDVCFLLTFDLHGYRHCGDWSSAFLVNLTPNSTTSDYSPFGQNA